MTNARLIDGEAVLRLYSYAERVGDEQEHAITPASDNQDRAIRVGGSDMEVLVRLKSLPALHCSRE